MTGETIYINPKEKLEGFIEGKGLTPDQEVARQQAVVQEWSQITNEKVEEKIKADLLPIYSLMNKFRHSPQEISSEVSELETQEASRAFARLAILDVERFKKLAEGMLSLIEKYRQSVQNLTIAAGNPKKEIIITTNNTLNQIKDLEEQLIEQLEQLTVSSTGKQ